MKTYIVYIALVMCLQSGFSFCKEESERSHNTSHDDQDTTRLYIENLSGRSLGFDINFPNDELLEGSYDNLQKYDTLTIVHQFPLHIITTNKDTMNDFVHCTFIINPGERVYIKERLNSTIAFKEADSMRNNELIFFASMQQKLGNYEGIMVDVPFKKLAPALRLQKIKDMYRQRMQFLKEYAQSKSLTKGFKERIENSFYYHQYTDFLSIYSNSNEFKRIYKQNKLILDFIRQMKIGDEFYDIQEYGEALYAKHLIEFPDATDYWGLYRKAKATFRGATRDLLLYKIIEYAERSPLAGELINDYLTIGTNVVLKNRIINEYGYGKTTKIELTKGGDIATSTLLKLDTEKEILWNDLMKNGDLKYIDFWATWCGACRAEFPNSKKLSETYSKEGVSFVYVSFDGNIGAWERVSEKEGLPNAKSYLLPDYKNSAVARQFGIYALPRYMIVGKDGQVINADAPRPSDPKIKELLDELLKK